MRPAGAQIGKQERHKLILGVVARKRVGTQHELAAALEASGCKVTQATISRDIRELGLGKPHQAVIDQHASELLADRFVDQHRRHRAINAAR